KGLAEKRRFAVVGNFIFAAVVTPPDIVSQCSLAIPMVFLYEMSIIASHWAERKRAEAMDEDESIADETVDETDFNT
ncbi:MAG: twin-arginine translocase subunit TatC, partial [Magnetospirillum sp.]